ARRTCVSWVSRTPAGPVQAPAGAWSACLDGVVGTTLQDLVHQAVGPGLGGALEIVAPGVAGDRLDALAGVLGQDLVQARTHAQDLARVDVDVRGLALEAAQRLVDHHPRIGQRIAL